MTERWLMDSVEMYQQTRDAIRLLENGGSLYVGKDGEGYTFLNAALPDSTVKRFKREILEEMKGCMIVLRSQIREVLDADEAEQLQLEGEKAPTGYVDQITPKNDYRRQQNNREDDDGK